MVMMMEMMVMMMMMMVVVEMVTVNEDHVDESGNRGDEEEEEEDEDVIRMVVALVETEASFDPLLNTKQCAACLIRTIIASAPPHCQVSLLILKMIKRRLKDRKELA